MDIEDAKKTIFKVIASDIEHAAAGNFDRISDQSQSMLANLVKNHMQGISRIELPINDRVTLGYVERPGGAGGFGGGGKEGGDNLRKEIYIRIQIP